MAFANSQIGKRDTRCTVIKPSVEYNADGVEVISSNTALSFWGKVTEGQDEGGLSTYKRLDARTITIEADSRTVTSVNILDTLTTDQSTDVYEIVDKYESKWKFTSMIIAQHKS